MYLEPIFETKDINRQVPIESRKFNTMERNLKRIIKKRPRLYVCNTNFFSYFEHIFFILSIRHIGIEKF